MRKVTSLFIRTDLCVGTVDPLQSKQPVGGAVAGVEVVLDYFGCPLCRVVIRIQLPSRHHILLGLLQDFLS